MEVISEILKVLQVVFGIGLVIFIHEMGHFIAARLCGVRVETFSLGFGPKLFGWRRGDTLYQVAAVPLGGYCRMAGEENRETGRPPAADELPSKPVGQRFFIYSGGVMMNVVFALVVFPIIFWIGVPFVRPTVHVLEGGAAWEARVPDHSEILEVNGLQIHDFGDIFTEVALGGREAILLTLLAPEETTPRQIAVPSQRDSGKGFRSIDVVPDCARDEAGRPILQILPDSPAARAGLVSGEALVEVVGGPLQLDPSRQLELHFSTRKALEVRVEDASGIERLVRIEPEMTGTSGIRMVGIGPKRNIVRGLRDSADTRALGIYEGDEILSVGGRPISVAGDLATALAAGEGEILFELSRGERTLQAVLPPLSFERKFALVRDLSLGINATMIVPQPGGPAARAGMLDEDRILRIDGEAMEDWDDIQRRVLQAGKEERAAVFELARIGPEGESRLTLSVAPQEHFVPFYGLKPRVDQYLYRSSSFAGAIRFGVRSSWNIMRQSWLMLQRMLFNEVSPKNVGGIITIGAVSYHVADTGWTKLLFFLCLLSINLAFINVLPIPVLDGGHLAFLIVEKIKGTPVSRRTLEYSQMVGVVLLLSLMVYVTYNDLVRWVF
ncbi:MAG: RIP metalloprotease RseP [Planctomycetes bacterium]|nr:RIP metalloprotease RseP [Planctomycetota bacterium]